MGPITHPQWTFLGEGSSNGSPRSMELYLGGDSLLRCSCPFDSPLMEWSYILQDVCAGAGGGALALVLEAFVEVTDLGRKLGSLSVHCLKGNR